MTNTDKLSPLRRERILVLGKEDVLQALALRVLHNAGFRRTKCCSDLAEAIGILCNHLVHAVIVLSSDGQIDPLGVARLVRSGFFGPDDSPIVTVTDATTRMAMSPFIEDSGLVALDIPDTWRLATALNDALRRRAHPTVLSVDDDPQTHATISEALDELYSVACASSGEEALAVLRERSIDLILLDLMLPGLQGDEILTRLPQPAPPIIVVTGVDSVDRFRRLMTDGAYHVIEKPIDYGALRRTCAAALRNGRVSVLSKMAIELERSLASVAELLIGAHDALETGRTARAKALLTEAQQLLPPLLHVASADDFL
ncbi:response regulator [Methylocaldum szegediense]|uniref:response regulator n=1 Tax=Methylocaldum szegediense TaxID=73780 RepID=UPI00040933CA|nr:response regulator [Methylocaldum szegediense]